MIRGNHFELYSEDDQSPSSQTLGSPRIEQLLDHNVSPRSPASVIMSSPDSCPFMSLQNEDNQSGARKAWGRGRVKPHGLLAPNLSGRGLLTQAPQIGGSLGHGGEASSKQTPQGPRMPDGTRGFTMGRGKPLSPVLGRSPTPAAALASVHL